MAESTTKKKFLDLNGLKHLWGKIVDKIESVISESAAAKDHKHTIADITDLAEATNEKAGLMSAEDKAALEGLDDALKEAGKIKKITYNGSEVAPSADGTVALTGPTKTSELTNDGDGTEGSKFATESYVNTKVTSVYRYKGSVESADKLPKENQEVGDVYDLKDTGMNVAWNGEDWDALGSVMDTSNFATKDDLAEALTNDEIDAALNLTDDEEEEEEKESGDDQGS